MTDKETAGVPMLAEDSSFYLPTDERRQATRFDKEPGTEFLLLCGSDGQEIFGEVQNESLGGMAVLVAQTHALDVGNEVRLCYAGDSLHAIIRHIEVLPEGRLRVGLDYRDQSGR